MTAPLSTTERLALAALAAAWVVPAWWLGASTVWGQSLAAATGALALLLALLARRRLHAGHARGLRPLPILITACAVAFLGLLLCQALNPDRYLVPGRPVGLLAPLTSIPWLPAGIAGPFDRLPGDFIPFANAWRHLLVAAAVLLPLAALAALPPRRAVMRALLALLVLHAAAFSAFALAHNLSGSHRTLWLVADTINYLGAPQFLGKNQQAAYQLLLLAATLGAWFAPASVRPAASLAHRDRWFALASGIVFLATVTTRSRAGLGGAAVLALAAAALALWPRRREWRDHRRTLLAAAAAGLLALSALALLPPVRATLERVVALRHETGDLAAGGSYRRILHDIAWEMTLDRPWFGHGAGCYVLLFTQYHPRVPAFMDHVRRFQPNWNRPVHVYADGDWIEFTAEYGLAGTALLAAPWLAALLTLLRLRPLAPATALLALGAALVLLHGSIDFVLRNPAILGLVAALVWLALRSARIDHASPHPAPAR